jgi:hypothetical protein
VTSILRWPWWFLVIRFQNRQMCKGERDLEMILEVDKSVYKNGKRFRFVHVHAHRFVFFVFSLVTSCSFLLNRPWSNFELTRLLFSCLLHDHVISKGRLEVLLFFKLWQIHTSLQLLVKVHWLTRTFSCCSHRLQRCMCQKRGRRMEGGDSIDYRDAIMVVFGCPPTIVKFQPQLLKT